MHNPFGIEHWNPAVEAVAAAILVTPWAVTRWDDPSTNALLVAMPMLAIWCGIVLVLTVRYATVQPGPRLCKILSGSQRHIYTRRLTMWTAMINGFAALAALPAAGSPHPLKWAAIAVIVFAVLVTVRYIINAAQIAAAIVDDTNDRADAQTRSIV